MRLEPHSIRSSYAQDGVVGPFRVLTEDQAQRIFRSLSFEREFAPTFFTGSRLPTGPMRFPINSVRRNRHLDLPYLGEMLLSATLLDTAQILLGDNLLLWRSHLLIHTADPKKSSHPWHRENSLELLSDPSRQAVLHIALNDYSESNCTKIVRGSHSLSDSEIENRYGLSIDAERSLKRMGLQMLRPDPSELPGEERMVLKAGEAIFLHPKLVQSCSVSPIPSFRVAMGLRLTTPDNRILPEAFADLVPFEQRAVLLRGVNVPNLNEVFTQDGLTGERKRAS